MGSTASSATGRPFDGYRRCLWYPKFNGRVLQSLAYIAGEGAHFLSFGEQGPPQLLI